LEKYKQNRECKEATISHDELYEIFLQNGYYFPSKHADDLFVRANADGDREISCEEFITIYLAELRANDAKRTKIVSNMLRIRHRNRGFCPSLSTLFIK
jgi:Ca2+-binding EF-hand superfamily protein